MVNKIRGQLVSKLLHMKQGNNSNSMRHLPYKDIDDICEYLLNDKKEIENLEYELQETMHYLKQYEKALDKACKELARTYPCGVNEYNTNCHPGSWKEWCMKADD